MHLAQLDRYLERIGLASRVPVTADGLETLHRAQVYTVPFENFDILLGRGVRLEPERLFDKLVGHRRGGYCFELNALFLDALRACGFTARPLLARVHLRGEPTGRGHQLQLVEVGARRFVADVGFGGPGLRAPMPLEPGEVRRQDGFEYRIEERDPFGYMLQLRSDDRWQDLYSFDLGTVVPGDILHGNHFTSTHPSSPFTFARTVALPSPRGRTTLFDLRLVQLVNGEERISMLPEGEGYLEALRLHFGIELDAPYSDLRPLAQPPEPGPGARP